MTKEDREQLDELTADYLRDYAGKAEHDKKKDRSKGVKLAFDKAAEQDVAYAHYNKFGVKPMYLKKLVKEAASQNPIGLKEAFSELMRERIEEALERKIEEISESLDEAKTYNQGDEIIHKGSRVGNTRSIHKATFQKMHNGNAMVKNKEGILYAVNPRDIVKRLGEETDQLDEISGSTLGSYIVKANKDMKKNQQAASDVMNKFISIPGTPTKNDIDDAQAEYMKHNKKANNRNRGLSNAESKLKGSSFARVHATEEYSNNRLYENMNRSTALKMDKEHGFYHDQDEDGNHHVFGASSGFSYSQHSSSADARKAAATMNKAIK